MDVFRNVYIYFIEMMFDVLFCDFNKTLAYTCQFVFLSKISMYNIQNVYTKHNLSNPLSVFLHMQVIVFLPIKMERNYEPKYTRGRDKMFEVLGMILFLRCKII